jgi:hypothetical protein
LERGGSAAAFAIASPVPERSAHRAGQLAIFHFQFPNFHLPSSLTGPISNPLSAIRNQRKPFKTNASRRF